MKRQTQYHTSGHAALKSGDTSLKTYLVTFDCGRFTSIVARSEQEVKDFYMRNWYDTIRKIVRID